MEEEKGPATPEQERQMLDEIAKHFGFEETPKTASEMFKKLPEEIRKRFRVEEFEQSLEQMTEQEKEPIALFTLHAIHKSLTSQSES